MSSADVLTIHYWESINCGKWFEKWPVEEVLREVKHLELLINKDKKLEDGEQKTKVNNR